MRIEDGTGRGYFTEVNSANKLEAQAVSEPEDKYLNKLGYAWTVTSSTTPVGANDIIFYIKNTGTNPLELTTVRAYAGAATVLAFKRVTGTPSYAAGVALTAVSRNLGTARTFNATVYEDTNTTGLTEDTNMYLLPIETANAPRQLTVSSAIIIPQGQAFAMSSSAATLVTATFSFAEIIE